MWRPDSCALGRLRDVSLSGGFVEGVPSRLPAWTEVYVQLGQMGFHGSECTPVKGYVVRSEATGVALEWCEFAPPEIRSLIDRAPGFTTPAEVQAAREGLQSRFNRGPSSAFKALAVCAAMLACVVSARAHAGHLEDLANYTGVELYKEHCASCHGEQGHGDGPVALSLRVGVPDLTRIAARQGGAFPVDRVRSVIDGRTPLAPHGTRNMPVWGWAFRASSTSTDAQAEYRTQALIGLLVDYLRSIQQK